MMCPGAPAPWAPVALNPGMCDGRRGRSSEPAPRAAHGAAESLLAAECGPEVVIALRPHYAALLSIADLALGNPNLRVFLRYVGELHQTLRTAEASAQHWRAQCTHKEEQLLQAHSQIENLRNQVAQERRAAQTRCAQLVAEARSQESSSSELRMAHDRLEAELERCQGEVMRLGAQGLAQSQALAAEQAAMMACSQEISRLRIELEVTGSMSRQNAAALEAARRQAANASLNADHASQEQVRLEALLRHTTKEQHSELLSTSEAATAEAARLRAKVDNNRSEIQGVRNALSGMEAMWAELRSIAPCTAEVVGFLRTPNTPAAQAAATGGPVAAGGLPPVRIPVLALRWRPGASLNTTPTWGAIRTGLLGVFHQLHSGSLSPEQVELTVCCADGRWFCAREEDDHRLGALLMFQALRRDAPISATCRVGTPHALMNMNKADLADASGLSVRSTGALWRVPPAYEEDFLRALMSDSPLKEDLDEFFYHRRKSRVEEALREEARRDPFSVALSAPPMANAAPIGVRTIALSPDEPALRTPTVPPAKPVAPSRPRGVI